MIRLAIFDLDGTILDTLEDLADALNHALTEFGYPARTLPEVRRFVGNGIRNLIRRSAPAGTQEAEIDRLHAAFSAYYAVHCADKTCPYAGIRDLLTALRGRGIRTAVVSNKPDSAVKPLCVRYFPDLFDAAVGERTGVARKPAPDSVNAVLAELGVDRAESVYIGDSEVDVATARNAGMTCFSVDWGFRTREELLASGAETIVSTPQALLELFA